MSSGHHHGYPSASPTCTTTPGVPGGSTTPSPPAVPTQPAPTVTASAPASATAPASAPAGGPRPSVSVSSPQANTPVLALTGQRAEPLAVAGVVLVLLGAGIVAALRRRAVR